MCSDPPDRSHRVAWRDSLVYAWSLGCPAFTLGHQGWESGALPGCFWVRSFSLGPKLRPLLRHSPPRSSILYCCQWGLHGRLPQVGMCQVMQKVPQPHLPETVHQEVSGRGNHEDSFLCGDEPFPTAVCSVLSEQVWRHQSVDKLSFPLKRLQSRDDVSPRCMKGLLGQQWEWL